MFALYRDPIIINNQQKKKTDVREGVDVAQSDSAISEDFPGGHRSPDRELGFHTPHGPKCQKIKQKQYCNKFNKNLKKKKRSTLKKKKVRNL